MTRDLSDAYRRTTEEVTTALGADLHRGLTDTDAGESAVIRPRGSNCGSLKENGSPLGEPHAPQDKDQKRPTSVACLPAARVVRSAPPRVVAPRLRTDWGPLRDRSARRTAPTSKSGRAGRQSGPSGRVEGRGDCGRSSTYATSGGRGGRGRAARSRLSPRSGTRAQVRQDLADHGGLRDARHDPHRAGAARAHEQVELVDLPQQRGPPARRLGGHEPRRGHDRHGGIGGGGLRPAA